MKFGLKILKIVKNTNFLTKKIIQNFKNLIKKNVYKYLSRACNNCAFYSNNTKCFQIINQLIKAFLECGNYLKRQKNKEKVFHSKNIVCGFKSGIAKLVNSIESAVKRDKQPLKFLCNKKRSQANVEGISTSTIFRQQNVMYFNLFVTAL